MQCQTKWTGGLGFAAQIRDHNFVMDTKEEAGGHNQGPTPKEFLLASICGCSGIDVVSILKKMRVDLISCEVNAKTGTTESYPSIFDEVKLQFQIKGTDIKPEQALKAVTLSMTKYCGVSAMVFRAAPISYEVFLNEIQIGSGRADFEGVPG